MDDKIDKMEKSIIEKVTRVKNIFKMPKNNNLKITFEKTYQEEPFQKELDQRVNLLKNLDKNPLKEKINEILKNNLSIDVEINKHIFKDFTNNEEYINKKYEDLYKDNKKYNNIFYIKSISKNIYNYQKKNILKYQNIINRDLLQFILNLYKNLNKNGSIIFYISIPNINLINIIYYLSILFEEVFIINKFIVFCKSFKKDIKEIDTIEK